MNIFVLSPHRDDAAFSVALAMHQWLGAGHRVTVLNCFTQSAYVPILHPIPRPNEQNPRIFSAIRQAEDEAFLAGMPGLRMTDMKLEDAPIRLHCTDTQVCELPVQPNDPAIPLLEKSVSAHLAAEGLNALVLPLALGQHVDHRVVRDASLPFSDHLPCAFYEDLPYATRNGAPDDLAHFRNDLLSRTGSRLSPVCCVRDQAVDFKLRLAKLYASQIDDAMAVTIARFSLRYGGGERLWANEAWLAISGAQNLSTILNSDEPEL